MSHDRVIEQLRRANPVPAPGAPAESREARDRTWSRLSTSDQITTPARYGHRSRRGLGRRRALILAGALLLIAAAIAGATLVSNELRGPDVPDLPGFGVDRAGAVVLGEQEGVRYFRTTSGASTCLSRTFPGTDVEGGRACYPPDQFAEAGGLIGVQRRGSSFLVAGLLPPGIDSALVSGERVPVREDGFLMARVDESPGTSVRVYGPGAPEAIAALSPYNEGIITGPPEGPSYEVSTTPWN